MDFLTTMDEKYREILEKYLKEQSEQSLYQSQIFSRESLEHSVSPEDIISIHRNLMLQLDPDMSKEMNDSFDILLEVMIGYGLAYREHQILRSKQKELNNEMDIAATMQQTLLGTKVPILDSLDIGAISVPAKKMSGDYYHFVQDEFGSVSVAIADIIGKGIPAALCMSMIKYAMDSLPENRHDPRSVLESLNRVVEQNVDASMFITMFYGIYNIASHTFSYSSAGHEPGYYYHADKDEFEELPAKGLLLGIEKKTRYKQFEREVRVGDMIFLMSDGVTECRTEEGFVESDFLMDYIRKYISLPAQEIVNNIFKDLEKLQNFQLRDDFTLIIMKRKL